MNIYDILTKKGYIPKVKGEGVMKGYFLIPCPFCKTDTEKKPHLSVSYAGTHYFCWKNREHKGSGKYLLKCLNIDNLTLEVTESSRNNKEVSDIKLPDLSIDVLELKSDLVNRFFNYRGLPLDMLKYLDYKVLATYSISGIDLHSRILLPTFDTENTLQHLATRSYVPSDLPHISKKRDYIPLFRFWNLDSFNNIVILESALDAVKFQCYCSMLGYSNVGVSAFFTNTPNKDQIIQLQKLYFSGKKIYYIMDDDSDPIKPLKTKMYFAKNELDFVTIVKELPVGVKDFGELSSSNSVNYVKYICNELLK